MENTTILGIDVGGSGIKGAPVDVGTGRMLADRYRIPTPDNATPEAVAEIVREIVRYFDWKGPIGCTVPARVEHGLVRTATNIHDDWINTRVDELFSVATENPVRTLNDADAAGLASMRFGAGKDRKGLVFLLTVGTGIGSALFFDGVLIPNTELGHLRMEGGTAEEFASDRTRKVLELTWEEWAGRFHRVLDYMEFLFAPDLFIIGGGVSRPAKAVQYRHVLRTNAELIIETLENEAGIIGAAVAAIPLLRRTSTELPTSVPRSRL